MRVILYLICFWFLISCARSPIRHVDEAMRPAKHPPQNLADDMSFAHLAEGLKVNIEFLSAQPNLTTFRFGSREVSKEVYLQALQGLLEALQSDSSGQEFLALVQRDFEFYEVYGDKRWGDVFVTGYFEPLMKGSTRPTAEFSQALYAPPEDLISIRLEAFAESMPNLQPLQDLVYQDKKNKTLSRDAVLRGRLLPKAEGQTFYTVEPYYERAEIDGVSRPLQGKGLELAYVSPIDAFFLQIQGSGVVKLPSGEELRLGYAAQNGWPYVAIGRYLLDVIPREQMSLQAIESYLKNVDINEAYELMNKNPSYVFFQKIPGRGVTYLGTEVVEGRTIATDYTYFPKGALAFLEFDKPHLNGAEVGSEVASAKKGELDNSQERTGERVSRFVLDQDTGGAIRGPHRVDLYWGRGEEAKRAAGVMRHPGRLYYLVPR